MSALGEYHDLSISKLARPSLDFPKPQIPLERLEKRADEFMSLREPLVDD